jgi:NAD(P)-dependent dehydrogenase (short-subunit alcohol dehydrogenase family)
MDSPLDGKIAMITGADRGIGRQIALELASRGATVVLTGKDAEALSETARLVSAKSTGKPENKDNEQLLSREADVTEPEQIAALCQEALAQFKRIDVLVNNAAIIGPTRPVAEIGLGDWEEVLRVNLTGAFICAKAVLAHMLERRCGKIINVASIAGKLAYPMRSPYAASKWGLIGFTKTLAEECGPYNIQVNAVCPGPVKGERIDAVIAARARQLNTSAQEVEKEYVAKSCMKRMVTESEVASVVAFLASAEADGITGEAIDITAGYCL